MLLWNESRKSGKSVSTSAATTLINKEDAVVLDIRTKKEWETGRITGARITSYNVCYTKLLRWPAKPTACDYG